MNGEVRLHVLIGIIDALCLERNRLSLKIASAKKNKKRTKELIEIVRAMSDRIQEYKRIRRGIQRTENKKAGVVQLVKNIGPTNRPSGVQISPPAP